MAKPNMIVPPVPHQPQQTQPAPVLQNRRRRRFRWEFVWALAAIFLAAWFLKNLPGPTFSWNDVMESVHVSRRGESRYTQIMVLGLVSIAVVYIAKMLRSK